MIEKRLANPFLGDGTKHPDEHLIYLDQVCGLFKLAGVPGHGIGYVMILELGIGISPKKLSNASSSSGSKLYIYIYRTHFIYKWW